MVGVNLANISEKIKIIFIICFCILILCFLAIFIYLKTNDADLVVKDTSEANRRISRSYNLINSLSDYEIANRDYLLVGDSSTLALVNAKERMLRFDYLNAKNDIDASFSGFFDTVGTKLNNIIQYNQLLKIKRQTNSYEEVQKSIMTDSLQRIMSPGLKDELNTFIIRLKEIRNRSVLSKANEQENFTKILKASLLLCIFTIILALFYVLKVYKRLNNTERLLISSQARLENILDMLPIGILIVTAPRKAYHANHRAIELMAGKIVADSIIDKNKKSQSDVFPQAIAEVLLINKALEGEKNTSVVEVSVDIDGRQLPLHVSATPLYNENGDIEYAVTVFDDITNIKKVEAELIEAKRLVENSLKLKESFLTNMSHEIRTPMNAIIGFTNLLAKKDLGAKQNEYVQTIRSAGENLLRLIDDILDFSKLDANMMLFEHQPFSIHEVIMKIVNLYQPKAQDKGLLLSFSYDEKIPQIVLGDAGRLTQVITNIVGNAIKFTENGSVLISAIFVKLKDEKTGIIKFNIKDSGIGIPKEKLDGVFNRFEQVNANVSSAYGGTGLGLSIAKHIVLSQGGSIGVTSELGIGAVFTFTMPFEIVEHTDAPASPRQKFEVDYSFLNNIKILLVEDNPINVKLAQGIFMEYDIQMDLAENGAVAVERVKQNSYDLVLMDIEMPVMNGYEATQKIRQDVNSHVPIIAMTAHALSGEREKCLNAGMNDYLTKPINVEELFNKIRNSTNLKSQSSLNIEINQPASEDKSPNDISLDVERVDVDLAYLHNLSGNNADFEKEMITLFLHEVPLQINALKQGVAAKDYKMVKDISHKLKSFVPIIGYDNMRPFFEVLERNARENSISQESLAVFDHRIHLIEDAFVQMEALIETDYNI